MLEKHDVKRSRTSPRRRDFRKTGAHDLFGKTAGRQDARRRPLRTQAAALLHGARRRRLRERRVGAAHRGHHRRERQDGLRAEGRRGPQVLVARLATNVVVQKYFRGHARHARARALASAS